MTGELESCGKQITIINNKIKKTFCPLGCKKYTIFEDEFGNKYFGCSENPEDYTKYFYIP